MKRILIALTFLGVLAGILFVSTNAVKATYNECQGDCIDYDWRLVCSNRWHGICIDWDWKKVCTEYKNTCTEPSPTPTSTPEASPSATPVPTPTPGLTTAGVPPARECKPLTIAVTVTWSSEDRKQWMWSLAEAYVDKYVVEYEVDGKVYTTTTTEPHFEFNEAVTRLRVATSHEGCVGPWSVWSGSGLPTGSK